MVRRSPESLEVKHRIRHEQQRREGCGCLSLNETCELELPGHTRKCGTVGTAWNRTGTT